MGARLVLVRALDPRVDCKGVVAPKLVEAIEAVKGTWREEMERALAAHGVEAETSIPLRLHGEELDDTVLRAAHEVEASIIAIGTQGSSILRRTLLGSLAVGVLRKTEVPLLLTGPAVEPPSRGGAYRVLFTSDGSPAAEAALPVFAPIFTAARAEVTLFQAVPPLTGISGGPVDVAPARARLDELAGSLGEGVRSTVEVTAIRTAAEAAGAILARAAARGVDVIAMSTHGHSARHHVLAGSVAMEILQKSPRPVLVARARALRGG